LTAAFIKTQKSHVRNGCRMPCFRRAYVLYSENLSVVSRRAVRFTTRAVCRAQTVEAANFYRREVDSFLFNSHPDSRRLRQKNFTCHFCRNAFLYGALYII
jgi:hypothetical protein